MTGSISKEAQITTGSLQTWVESDWRRMQMSDSFVLKLLHVCPKIICAQHVDIVSPTFMFRVLSVLSGSRPVYGLSPSQSRAPN